MEYLNGGDLYSLLRNLGCLDEDVARIYIAEVVSFFSWLFPLILLLLLGSKIPACNGWVGARFGVSAFPKCGSP